MFVDDIAPMLRVGPARRFLAESVPPPHRIWFKSASESGVRRSARCLRLRNISIGGSARLHRRIRRRHGRTKAGRVASRPGILDRADSAISFGPGGIRSAVHQIDKPAGTVVDGDVEESGVEGFARVVSPASVPQNVHVEIGGGAPDFLTKVFRQIAPMLTGHSSRHVRFLILP